MKQLFKADFDRDSFSTFINGRIRSQYLQKTSFAYRLAKYAQQNKYDADKEYLARPLLAVKIFIDEFKKYRRNYVIDNFEHDVIALFLTYVMMNSYLLTFEDINEIFGTTIKNKVKMTMTIFRIANSRAKITKTKRQKYKDDFPKRVILIKAAIIIAELRALSLIKSKTFPTKVFERYLSIFDSYIEVGEFVADELKKWLLQKIKKAQALDYEKYNLTKGDLFRYFEIISDKRFT